MSKLKDIRGQRFGRLVALRPVRIQVPLSTLWECQCDCGNLHVVRLGNLQYGRTQSCGCLQRDYLPSHPPNRRAHGLSKTQTYRAWAYMKDSCSNPNAAVYARYGGAGITFPAAWCTFDGFLNDMGIAPDGHTLTRHNLNSDFSPENCFWIGVDEHYKRNLHALPIPYQGETLCLSEWAERLGMSKQTLSLRLKSGWSVQDALSTPVLSRRESGARAHQHRSKP